MAKRVEKGNRTNQSQMTLKLARPIPDDVSSIASSRGNNRNRN